MKTWARAHAAKCLRMPRRDPSKRERESESERAREKRRVDNACVRLPQGAGGPHTRMRAGGKEHSTDYSLRVGQTFVSHEHNFPFALSHTNTVTFA